MQQEFEDQDYKYSLEDPALRKMKAGLDIKEE